MSLTDPVADMLTRVRNACMAGHRRVGHAGVEAEGRDRARFSATTTTSRTTRCWTMAQHGLLRLYLKYHNDAPGHPRAAAGVVAGPAALRQGARDPARQERPRHGDPQSTPQGLMTDREARTARVGGEAARGGLVGGRRCHASAERPVTLPKGVTAQLDGQPDHGQGTEGRAQPHAARRDDAGRRRRQRRRDSGPPTRPQHKALHGLTRTLVANMVEGVTEGLRRSRSRFRASATRRSRSRSACSSWSGFSHPVPYHAPKGIKITVDEQRRA